MGFWRGKKLGDTLVEVTIAIGIFSLVAIAVVSVVSNSTSSAQSNLENTVTREEIDAQAEAIRFIHDSSVMDTSESDTSVYKDIWKQIEDVAVEAKGDALEGIENYTPTSCEAPFKYTYKGANYDYSGNAFVINYNALNTLDGSNIVKILGNTNYQESQTFPRIAYGTDESLSGENTLDGTFKKAEGIFVLAVKDPGSTYTSEGGEVKKTSAYVDFYIRTCWFAANANTPSTISTVIRLTSTKDSREEERGYDSTGKYIYHQTTTVSGGGERFTDTNDVISGHWKTLRSEGFPRTGTGTEGWSFAGKWCHDKKEKASGAGKSPIVVPSAAPGSDAFTTCTGGEVVTPAAGSNFYNYKITVYEGATYHFYEMLKQNPAYYVKYDANKEINGGVCQYYNGTRLQTIPLQSDGSCKHTQQDAVNGGEEFTKNIVSNARNTSNYYKFFAGKDKEYTFIGWCTKKVTKLYQESVNAKDICEKTYGGDYYSGSGSEKLKNPKPTPTEGGTTVLYAMWKKTWSTVKYDPGDHGYVYDSNKTTDKKYDQGDGNLAHTIRSVTDAGIKSNNKCYDFKNWNTRKDGKGTTYNPGTQNTFSEYSETTLYAQWNYVCYTVKYNANGGTGSMGDDVMRTDSDYNVKSNAFTRGGHAFTGWNTSTDGNGTAYAEGTLFRKNTIKAGTVITLFAQWKKNECNLPDQHFGAITINNTVNQYFDPKAPGTSSWKEPGLYPWTVPAGCEGWYRMQVWGSQGGGDKGGKGGYANGFVYLTEKETVYVVIGAKWGLNGGGTSGAGDTGGGATHIATNLRGDGQLSNYAGNSTEVLLVAGGGGGGKNINWDNANCLVCQDSIDEKGFGWCTSGVNKYIPDIARSKEKVTGGAGGYNNQSGNGYNGANPFEDEDQTMCMDPGYYIGHGNTCQHVIPAAAEGGTASGGGSGAWGTDLFDPYITNSNGVRISGQLWVSFPDHYQATDGYPGKNSGGHHNQIGNDGSFGQGGDGGIRIRKMDSCTDSRVDWNEFGNIATYVWNESQRKMVQSGVGHSCNLDQNDTRKTRNGSIQYNSFYPGNVETDFYRDGFSGGGGGWYGGGAGAPAACLAASAGGGSSHIGNDRVKAWVGSGWGWFSTDSGGGNTAYGQAVIRKCQAGFNPSDPNIKCEAW